MSIYAQTSHLSTISRVCGTILLMDDALSATWTVLFGIGVFAQVYGPKKYAHKNANQYAAIVSSIFLLNSVVVSFFAFDHRFLLASLYISSYLLINAWVLVQWRFHPLRTRRQVVRSALILATYFGAFTILDSFDALTQQSLSVAVLIFSLAGLYKILLFSRESKMGTVVPSTNGKHPTVSIAIPARNETHALTNQLRSVVKSDYPKLEILVLDDCSQDDTAQIIRSFAHDGIRFIQGIAPSDSWIGKNRAYQNLSEESSGDYILFSGVDTRYSEATISTMMEYMHQHKLDMVSFMPYHSKLSLWSMVIQPIRYALVVLGSSKKNPPVLSSVWLIKAEVLKKYGGFDAVSNSIEPERYFAKRAAQHGSYRFLIAPKRLGLTTYKKPSSQFDTATRNIYPRLKKLVALQASLVILAGIVFLYPLAMVGCASMNGWNSVSSLFGLSLLVWTLAYAILVSNSYPLKMVIFSPIYFFAGLFSMIYISFVSMFWYELDRIVWKGRSVCYPVMLDALGGKK